MDEYFSNAISFFSVIFILHPSLSSLLILRFCFFLFLFQWEEKENLRVDDGDETLLCHVLDKSSRCLQMRRMSRCLLLWTFARTSRWVEPPTGGHSSRARSIARPSSPFRSIRSAQNDRTMGNRFNSTNPTDRRWNSREIENDHRTAERWNDSSQIEIRRCRTIFSLYCRRTSEGVENVGNASATSTTRQWFSWDRPEKMVDDRAEVERDFSNEHASVDRHRRRPTADARWEVDHHGKYAVGRRRGAFRRNVGSGGDRQKRLSCTTHRRKTELRIYSRYQRLFERAVQSSIHDQQTSRSLAGVLRHFFPARRHCRVTPPTFVSWPVDGTATTRRSRTAFTFLLRSIIEIWSISWRWISNYWSTAINIESNISISRRDNDERSKWISDDALSPGNCSSFSTTSTRTFKSDRWNVYYWAQLEHFTQTSPYNL